MEGSYLVCRSSILLRPPFRTLYDQKFFRIVVIREMLFLKKSVSGHDYSRSRIDRKGAMEAGTDWYPLYRADFSWRCSAPGVPLAYLPDYCGQYNLRIECLCRRRGHQPVSGLKNPSGLGAG